MPLITLLVFSGIETADMVFLSENLKSVSYEGGRAAAKFNSTNQEVLDRVNAIIDARQISGATTVIELPPNRNDVSETARGERIRVTVSAPAAQNTVGPLKLYSGKVLSSATIMVRE